MQPQTLDQTAGLADQLLQHGVAVLGTGVAEHFHLVELVAADHAALAGAIRAGLAAVAGRVGEQALGQVGLVENFAAVQVDQRGFRRREQEVEAFLGQTEHVILKLRKLAGRQAALVGQDVRRQHELVAILQMLGDEVVEQRPLELRALAGV